MSREAYEPWEVTQAIQPTLLILEQRLTYAGMRIVYAAYEALNFMHRAEVVTFHADSQVTKALRQIILGLMDAVGDGGARTQMEDYKAIVRDLIPDA